MDDITIILVNWFSADYIDALIHNLCTHSAAPERLQFLILDNTNGQDTALRALNDKYPNLDIRPVSPSPLKSSKAHAFALNYAMSVLATRYGLVCDPDIHVFRPRWDAFLIDLLRSTDAVAAGAPYPEWKTGKYHDFPSPPFCFFDTQKLKNLCTDWSPFSPTPIGFMWKFLVRQVGRLGLVVSRHTYQKYHILRRYSAWAERTLGVFAPDTGWKIARAAREKGARSIVFDAIMPDNPVLKKQARAEIFIELACHYELFFFDNEPFVVHKYGSQGLLWKTRYSNDRAFWENRIHLAQE